MQWKTRETDLESTLDLLLATTYYYAAREFSSARICHRCLSYFVISCITRLRLGALSRDYDMEANHGKHSNVTERFFQLFER